MTTFAALIMRTRCDETSSSPHKRLIASSQFYSMRPLPSSPSEQVSSILSHFLQSTIWLTICFLWAARTSQPPVTTRICSLKCHQSWSQYKFDTLTNKPKIDAPKIGFHNHHFREHKRKWYLRQLSGYPGIQSFLRNMKDWFGLIQLPFLKRRLWKIIAINSFTQPSLTISNHHHQPLAIILPLITTINESSLTINYHH